MQPTQNNSGFCGNVSSKTFEIFLIVGFSCGTFFLIVNLLMTIHIFIMMYILFYIEVGIIALNIFCIIFSIILRVWRSNGSVLNTNYSSSHCISIIILILIIMNLLGSIGEDIFYFFVNSEKESKIKDFIGKHIKLTVVQLFPDSFYGDKTEKLIKYLPWVCFNLNLVIQVVALVFLILLMMRIKNKSDDGTPTAILTQNLQPSSIQNPNDINKNEGINLENNNAINNNNVNDNNKDSTDIYKGEEIPAKKKKTKKKKSEKKKEKALNSNPDSDQVEIMKKKKKKKKSKKKSKEKKKVK